MGQRIVYMDHAATSFTKPEVLTGMLPYYTERFGNPPSVYSRARESKQTVEEARGRVAKALGARPEECSFTAGESEPDNRALKGVAFANRTRGNHIVTSKIEHHAVLSPCQWLEKPGFTVTYLPVREKKTPYEHGEEPECEPPLGAETH